ncbi:hypothetical protein PAHAL_6G144200 [Panicum hallii]|uniref:Uncharacterized protein n=1 Tax=Panicum hallii TaxID=206008 RepID=A0A2T8IGG0_9POAL|nr:hypothetical protein PAHAL_6G144200 [Panicum hallii]
MTPMTAFPEVTRLYSDCTVTVSLEGNGYGSYGRFSRGETAIFRLHSDGVLGRKWLRLLRPISPG